MNNHKDGLRISCKNFGFERNMKFIYIHFYFWFQDDFTETRFEVERQGWNSSTIWVFPGFPVSANVPSVSCWNIWLSLLYVSEWTKISWPRADKSSYKSCLIFEVLHQGKCTYYHMLVKGFQFPLFDFLCKVGRVSRISQNAHHNIFNGIKYAHILSDWRIV